MKNELQIFNYNDKQVRTVMQGNDPWWVLKDVCEILGLSSPHKVAERLDADELTGIKLRSGGQNREMTIINESGLYNVILRSDKPEAKAFKRWVTHEVLPTIRKTGRYEAKPMTDYQQMMAETRRHNVAVQKARLLNQIAAEYDGTYKQVLQAHATKELTGEFLLPLPKLEAKTYSAEDIGSMLGISSNMVGRIANANGLKCKEYGAWFNDKARGHNKEVQSFRYYEGVIPVFQSLIQKDAV